MALARAAAEGAPSKQPCRSAATSLHAPPPRPTRRAFGRIAALAGPALAAGCSPARLLDAFVPTTGYRLVADRAYGDGPRRRLDIYVPDRATAPAPIVVFLYGGAWRSGDKGIYRFVGQALASQGFAVAIPDYRLYPEVRFPGFLEDCAAAVAWVRAHAAEFGEADPQRIHLMGHSAGAYDAAMLTLDESWLAAVGLDARRDVRATVGLAGPYDFYPFTDEKTAEVFASAMDPRATQPIEFVDGDEPPMLLATGLDDDTVRPRNTFRLAERIRAQGGRVEVRAYPGVGHIKLIAALAEPLRSPDLPVLGDVVGFLDGIDGHAA